MTRPKTLLPLAVLLSTAALAAPAAAVFTIDGTRDAAYGTALATQTTQTNFGNATGGTVDNASGSELDVAYAVYEGDKVFVFLSGNLESNFNKIELFFDCITGAGQNRLRGDNPNVDFNGLNRMGDDGGGNGLKFDTGFDADFWISVTGGGGPYQMFANYSEVRTAGGGTGGFLGQTGAASNGVLSGGTNPYGIKVTINNTNGLGVDGGCLASSGAGVTTGIELEIPIAALGSTKGPVKICAFVNGGSHDFLSNQVLGPLPATCNLGEPRAVDFSTIAGNQFFSADNRAVPMNSPWVMVLLSLGLLVGSALILRRRASA